MSTAGSSSSGGGSGSGSHKKSPSISSTPSGGAKKGSAKGVPNVAARKVSVKPAVVAPLPTPLTLEHALASPATHTPQPLWPTWTASRAFKEGASKSAFVEGLPTLPASLASVCVGWKRLGELYPPGLAEKLLTVTPLEGAHTVHRAVAGVGANAHRGWNQLVAAQFNLILAKRKLLSVAAAAVTSTSTTSSSSASSSSAASPTDANFLWSHIQPANPKDGLVRFNPIGKYVLRVFHQGEWKLLVVDDQVPVDAAGQCILPVSSNPCEIWPTLLAKALLKLWPGYDFALDGAGGGTEILYSLCGWVTQTDVVSQTLLSFPYSKVNRPSSPLLPFNPLTDSPSEEDAAALAASVAALALAATLPPASPRPLTASRGTTPADKASSTSRGGRDTAAASTTGTARKPLSARKDREEEEPVAAPVGPPQPLTTEELHKHSSRRGELGWFNELVYAAPGSTTVSGDQPSGLLFAYAWSATGTGIEGFPSLAAVLKLEERQVPLFGQLGFDDYDPTTNPLNVAIAAAAAGPQGAGHKSRSASIATMPSAVSSAAGAKGKKDAPAPPPAITTPPPQVLRVDTEPEVPEGPPPSRFHCLLLESFDAVSELAEIEALGNASRLSDDASAKGRAKGAMQPPSSAGKKPTSAGAGAQAQPPTTPGKGRSKKEDEERARRAEEEERALAEAQAKLNRLREEEIARGARAHQRMEAWLRGEEAMLAEEEMSKTTPQLKVTDLLSGAVAIVRVDSFAAAFDHVHLVRDQSRYVCAERSVDLWAGRDLGAQRKPFSCSSSLVFVADAASPTDPTSTTGQRVPLFASAPKPPTLDLASATAQGVPAAAALALQAHHEKEYASARIIEAAAHARRLYIHLEFQATHQVTSGLADSAEQLVVIPDVDASKQGQQDPSASPSSGSVGKKTDKAPSAKPSRPVSGPSGSKKSSAPSEVPSSGDSHLGPLHLATPPLTWRVQVERFDWSTNRREILLERSLTRPPQERRLECLEFILPPTEPLTEAQAQAAAAAQAAQQLDIQSAATSRPPSGGGLGLGGLGGSKKIAPSKSSKDKEKERLLAAASSESEVPSAGITYRVVVHANCGYAMSVFSHASFELEEGKPGATAQMSLLASGESNKKGETNVVPPGSVFSPLGVGTALAHLAPSTYVRSIEGTYAAQHAGTPFVLFKYVLEVPTPVIPTTQPNQAAQVEAFNTADEVSLAVAGSEKKGSRSTSSASSKSASASDKKKASAAAASLAAAAAAATVEAESLAAASLAASARGGVTYSKHLLPATAAQANQSLTKSWLHPSKGQPGGGVCFPVPLVRAPAAVESTTDLATVVPSLWAPTSSSLHPSSTVLSVALSLGDVALVPYVRLEWVDNDTLDSWAVPFSGEQHTPAMQFRPNRGGYTLTATACVPNYQVFAGRFWVKLVSSRPLLSCALESLGHVASFADSYLPNSSRTLCRLVVSAASATKASSTEGANVSQQAWLHLSSSIGNSAALCARVYDLEATLDHPLSRPPPPIQVVMGLGSLMVPVVPLGTRGDVKCLVEVLFDPLHPTAELLESLAAAAAAALPPPPPPTGKDKDLPPPPPPSGVFWSARFVSSTPLSVQLDKAPEDELALLKATWAQADPQRPKKARASREAFLEKAAAYQREALAKATLGSSSSSLPPIKPSPPVTARSGTVSTGTKALDLVPLPPLPRSPLSVASRTSQSLAVVAGEAAVLERATLAAAEVEKARLLRVALERQRECIVAQGVRAAEAREAGVASWRSELDVETHETWVARSGLRRALITAEVEQADLRAVVNQISEATANLQTASNYDECNASHTPFNDLVPGSTIVQATTTTGSKERSSSKDGAASSRKRDKGGEHALALESGRFGLAAYLEALEGALPPVASMPRWKGGQLTAAAVTRVHEVLTEALRAPLVHAAAVQAHKEMEAAAGPVVVSPPASRKGGEKPPVLTAKETKAALAAAAAAALADGIPAPPAPLDRLSLSNALWAASWQARSMSNKISSATSTEKAQLAAEVALLALSTDHLEKACEPIWKAQATAAAAAQAAASASLGEKQEEEKEQEAQQKVAPQKSSSKSQKAAAAAAALAATQPQAIDFGALETWLAQVAQYDHLARLNLPLSHEDHPQTTLSTTLPRSPFASRPTSAAGWPTSVAVATTDAAADAQWFGAGSEHARASEESSTPATSLLTLPPIISTFGLATSDVAECSMLAAAALGRDTINLVLTSLPSDSGVTAAELLPTPVDSVASQSNIAPPLVACCGACFLRALLVRASSLSSTANAALALHRDEVAAESIARLELEGARATSPAQVASPTLTAKHAKKSSNGGTSSGAGAAPISGSSSSKKKTPSSASKSKTKA